MKALTKAERRRVSDAFIRAKDSLATEYSSACYSTLYICYSLDYQADRKNITEKTRDLAITIIQDRLNGSVSLYDWLVKNGVHPYPISRKALQAHRHKWLDILAEEFRN